MFRALAAAACLMLVSGCVSIGAFNTFTPHDDGGVRAAESMRYGEGPRRTLDVYVPASRPANAPVLVFFYGGGWSVGKKDQYSFVGDAFAAHGFVTVVPDYRLYPEVRFPEFLADGAAALRWVQDNIARYGGDPNRIVLAGHSAGAYNAVMLGLDSDYLRAAGVDAHAVRGVIGLAGPYIFPLDHPLISNVFGGAPSPTLTQPINFARRDAPPLLLLTGDHDERIPPRSVFAMRDAMQSAGAAADARVYPGMSHGGIIQAVALSRRGEAPVFEDMLAFARRVSADTTVAAPQASGAH